jgi:protein-S-isoprenylcysteine O-methyltransferase Ste14
MYNNMNMHKKYFLISAVVFSLAALLHALRVLLGLELTLGSTVIPVWLSIAAVIVAGALAYFGYWASRQ